MQYSIFIKTLLTAGTAIAMSIAASAGGHIAMSTPL